MTPSECAAVAVRFAVDTIRREGPQPFHRLARWVRGHVLDVCPGGPGWSRRGAADMALWEAHRAGLLQIEGRYLPGGEYIPGMVQLAGEVRGILRRCQADDLHPGAVFVAPREETAKILADIAPQSAHHLQTPAPPGSFWTVTLASGGTQVGRVQPQEAKA